MVEPSKPTERIKNLGAERMAVVVELPCEGSQVGQAFGNVDDEGLVVFNGPAEGEMVYGWEPGTQAFGMEDVGEEAVCKVFVVGFRDVDISEQEMPALVQPVVGDQCTSFQGPLVEVVVQDAQDLPDYLSGYPHWTLSRFRAVFLRYLAYHLPVPLTGDLGSARYLLAWAGGKLTLILDIWGPYKLLSLWRIEGLQEEV